MRRGAVLVAVAALVGACGSDDDEPAAPTGGCRTAERGEVTIVAEGVAWDVDCVEAPAGEALTVTVDNRDDGVQHNLHLPDAPGEPATDLEAGPVTQRLEVDLPAGDYEYVCDIHPNMVGTLRVTGAKPPDP